MVAGYRRIVTLVMDWRPDRCYRLTRHGVFIGEYKTFDLLGKLIDLAELVEDESGGPRTGE